MQTDTAEREDEANQQRANHAPGKRRSEKEALGEPHLVVRRKHQGNVDCLQLLSHKGNLGCLCPAERMLIGIGACK